MSNLPWDLVVDRILIRLGKDFYLKSELITIYPGEFVLIKGKSGEGKTTFALSLAGLLPPAQGKILFSGKDIYALDRKERLKIVSFFPQNFFSIVEFDGTIGDFVKLVKPSEITEFEKNFLSLLRELGLNETILRRNFKSLSFGERQRVILAIVLAKDSHIYILDEPDSALDSCSKLEFFNLLTNFLKKARSKAFIVISHKLQTYKFFSKVINVEKGKIEVAFSKPPSAIGPANGRSG
jgi:ABC-type cobalamin/Fe3+-siderophores transport system ATPase subunit